MEWTLTRRGRLLTAALAATLALVGMLFRAAPAGAAATESDTLVFVSFSGSSTTVQRNGNPITFPSLDADQTFEGNFTGAPGTDIFYYSPGSTPDGILHITPSGEGVATSFRPKGVNGAYRPLVGDFDGNGIDDIFWYAPGQAGDHIWLFDSGGRHAAVGRQVHGDYRTAVLDVDGDSDDDIVWHGAGSAPDNLWRMNNGVPTSTQLTINGDYILVPGYFGDRLEGSPQKRLIFFSYTGGDSIWTFAPGGSHTSASLPTLNGVYRPIVGRFNVGTRDSILWYRPGFESEAMWSFTAGGAVNELDAPPVRGAYQTAVGDYDGNGLEDIAFATSGAGSIWKFNGSGYTIETLSPPDYFSLGTTYTDYLP